MAGYIKNERGVALMMVLVISAVSLAVMGTLMSIVVMGTQLSGGQKRFTTALEAGKGGEGVIREFIGTRDQLDSDFVNAISYSKTISNACIADKLNKETGMWVNCMEQINTELTINGDDPESYDFRFELGDFYIFAKIVNTIEGNTGPSNAAGLMKGGVVAANSGEVSVKAVSAIYAVEVDARSSINPKEKAKLSILYQY
ncbi:hypothetical protein ACFLZI_03865 [Nitrospirota bacterium]